MEIFWPVFFRIWTEYRGLIRKSLHSAQIRENTDQKNSISGHILGSVTREVTGNSLSGNDNLISFLACRCFLKIWQSKTVKPIIT